VEREIARGDVAGAIIEPIQSLGGVRVASAAFLRGLRQALARAGAFLIYDEVQTGFGRTGTAFYAGRHGVLPDFVALAKGIASGVPMGALLVRDDLAAKLKTGDLGTTFGGGPLAAAACEATLRVLREEKVIENAARVGAAWIDELRRVPGVAEVRGEGFLIGLVFEGGAKPVQLALLEKGFITGLSDDPRVLRLLPPLVLTREEAASFTAALAACAGALAAAR
jgi:acetylornithine/succinyldiaminopimelate/putrescine aminotransferase